MTDPFKEAKVWLDHKFRGITLHEDHPLVTVYKALLICSRLQQEPSEAMMRKGDDAFSPEWQYLSMEDIFKAMTQQLMKECDNEAA